MGGEGPRPHGLEGLLLDELGEERKARLQAVSLDLGSAYAKATTEEAPHVA